MIVSFVENVMVNTTGVHQSLFKTPAMSTDALLSSMLPHKMPKCGRPKGSSTTVVRLSKKKQCLIKKPVPFLLMPEQERTKSLYNVVY